MAEEGSTVQLDAATAEKAIAALAMRIANLEMNQTSPAGVASGNDADLRGVMSATLTDLKNMRTALVRAVSEVDERLKELSDVKSANAKLKYQVKHLKRSLEAEEEKNAAS